MPGLDPGLGARHAGAGHECRTCWQPQPAIESECFRIIGGGPSVRLLSQLLYARGIDSVVLERKTKDYVLSRIRAGVLEQGFVRTMEDAGCAERLRAEGSTHDGTLFSYGDQMFRVDFREHAGTPVVV